MKHWQEQMVVLGLILLILINVSCAPGNKRFDTEPAGFWAGLWHGLICVITFVISLFTDSVSLYEVNNNGGWYNFGFLLGVLIALGGSWGPYKKKRRHKDVREKEWEEIAVKVEEKIRRGIRNWVDETEDKESDWEDIGKKIEEKIKRELRNWANK